MNNFQTILTAVFLAFFVFAVLVFSGIINIGGSSGGSSGATGKVVIWGTFDSTPDLLKVFEDATGANNNLSITYIKKDKATYQDDLVKAFASDTGPDLFFITPDMVIPNDNYIYKIPYASYPEQTFRDSFIDGAADIYLAKDGVVGFPIVVDPIVMYYNKDILANEGISQPPTTWDSLVNMSGALTKKQDDGTILQSTIALGRFDNVTNAKDILATLLLQNGNQIMERTDTGYAPVLEGSSASTADNVMNFFVQFSSPSNAAYSWNRSLTNSTNMFTSGKLAFYLGHASELFAIQSVNPNLSFDVAPVPQPAGVTAKRTDADIYAVAVNKKSTNIGSAFAVAGMISTGDTASALASALSLPPALRSLLAVKPTDPYLFTFFNQAVISHSWLDPNSAQTDGIFNELVNNIVSNTLSTGDALAKTQSELGLLSGQN